MTQTPNEGDATTAGRGADLFFGDDPEPQGIDTAPSAEDAPAAITAASGDEAAEAYDNAVEGAYQSSDVAVEEAEEMRQITGESSNGAAPAATIPPPETAAPPPAEPPPVATADKSGDGSSRGCLIGLGALLLGALLGATLALAVLFSTNSGLNYASSRQVADLANTAGQLRASADALRNDVAALQGAASDAQASLDTLTKQQEVLSQTLEAQAEVQAMTDERLTAVETEAAGIDAVKTQLDETATKVTGLESEVTGVSDQVAVIATQLDTVTQQMEEVAVSAKRSDNFLTGMAALLASLDEAAPTATAPVTETLVATPTVEVRSTITPSTQLTETVAPTATLAVTLTPTIAATITVTPSVEATAAPTATVAPTTTVAPEVTPTPAGSGAIRGIVYFDRDRNGTLDNTVEPGIAGVQVTLYNQDRTQVAQATTNFRGQFGFTELAPGIYVVVESDPPNFLSSTPNNYTVRITGATPIPEVSFGDYR